MPRTKEQNREIREKTKNSILEAALQLFSDKGFHATSMNNIAVSAGVSKGLAYNYFESKQHIVQAILKNVMEMLAQKYMPVSMEKDPYKKLELLSEITFDWVKNFWKMFFAFLIQPGVFEKSGEFFKDFYGEIFVEIENIFREIGVADYVAEARIYGALLDGVAMDYLVDKENYPLDEVAASIKKRYSREMMSKLI